MLFNPRGFVLRNNSCSLILDGSRWIKSAYPLTNNNFVVWWSVKKTPNFYNGKLIIEIHVANTISDLTTYRPQYWNSWSLNQDTKLILQQFLHYKVHTILLVANSVSPSLDSLAFSTTPKVNSLVFPISTSFVGPCFSGLSELDIASLSHLS